MIPSAVIRASCRAQLRLAHTTTTDAPATSGASSHFTGSARHL
ncbi:hypothetical protein OG559_09230 [Micromonospora sp. NBC_01405]